METHRNDDAIEAAMRSLAAKAEEMTHRAENTITSGLSDERPLWETERLGFIVRRLPDDEACLRISIGRPTDPLRAAGVASYLVLRGDHEAIRGLLASALETLDAVLAGGWAQQ